MKIVQLDQRSDEWHEWRRRGIGASEAPVLTGDAYNNKTPYKLWEEKCGFKKNDVFFNSAMEHGVKCESMALEKANAHVQNNCVPICVEDEELPFMRASLDGWDADDSVLIEVKCPVNETILDNARCSAIPNSWAVQIQWQMMIAKPRKAYLVVWDYRHEAVMVIEVFENLKLQEELREKAIKFWDCVKFGRPPQLTDFDYEEKTGEELEEAVKKFKELHEEKRKIAIQFEEARQKVIEFSSGGNFQAYGVKVGFSDGRGSYNLDQMRIDGIDVDKYKKPGKKTCTVSLKKPKES